MLLCIIVLAIVIFFLMTNESFMVPKLDVANMAYRSLPGDAPPPREYDYISDDVSPHVY